MSLFGVIVKTRDLKSTPPDVRRRGAYTLLLPLLLLYIVTVKYELRFSLFSPRAATAAAESSALRVKQCVYVYTVYSVRLPSSFLHPLSFFLASLFYLFVFLIVFVYIPTGKLHFYLRCRWFFARISVRSNRPLRRIRQIIRCCGVLHALYLLSLL